MKRFVSIIFSVLIAFISVFGITSAKAASYPSKLENVNKNYLINYSGYNLYYKTYSGGYVFCTSFHVQGVGTSCTLSNNQWSTPTQAGIAAIVKKYNSNKTAQNYYYAELAINEFLYYKETADKTNRISSVNDVRNYTGVADYYREAVKAYDQAKAKYTITLSPSTVNFKLVGDYYISDKITVKQSNGAVGGYGIHLSGDVKSELESKNGNEFYIRVKKSDIKPGTTSNITILVNGKKYMNVAKKFDCGSGNQTMTPNTYTSELLATATATITGKITLKGNKVNINKIDSETKKPVSGAVLVVKNSKGKEIAKFTTSEKAYELKNLEAGEYTVTEEEAPEGYKKSSEIVKFNVANDDKTVNVEFKNEKIKNPVEVSKKDATTSKELPGAHLVVKDADGNVVDEWTSTKEEHKIKDLKPGKYTLSETIAPEGYRLSTTTVEFEVKGDGSTTKVEMLNEPMNNTKVKINKIDADTKETLSGATIVIKNKEGKEVLKLKSSDKAKVIDNLEVGEYTAVEVEAPKGYQLNKKAVSFKVNKDDKTVNIEILNTKYVTKVEVSKKDATTSKELPGAHLVVKDADGNVVDEWVSTDEVHIIKGLKEGKFTLSETIAPEGYRLQTTTVEFEVKADGSTTKVEMLNEPMNNTKVKINKIDADTKETLSGATIVIKNKEGKEVLKFKSSDKAKVIDNLEVGEYTAVEVEAPKGYQLNKKAVSFNVNKDDKTINVEILNTKNVTRVEVSKKDATTSKELPGAHLVVKDADGNVVDEWISTSEEHKIKDLKPGKYTLSETIAPEGYRLSTTTVEFEVKGDGSTTKVEMLNEPMNNTKVKINKIDADTKETLSGATIVIKNKEGKEVLKFKSSDKAKVIDNLEVGEYTAVEVEAPKGYQLNKKAVSFKVNKDDKTINVEILNTKYVTKVEVSKKDATTSKELPGAHLVVKDADGNVVDEWVSTDEVHIIKGLKEGKFTLSETIAPEGYRLQTTTVEFEVKADGSTTKVEMLNEPMNNTKVKINKIDADTKETLEGATLVIKDSKGNEVKSFVTTKESYEISDLELGTYTVSETKAPEGYELSNEVKKFTVSRDDKEITVDFTNRKTPKVNTVEISKKDATTSEELPGAHLVVKNSEGKVIDEWVSTSEVHIIKGIEAGTYTLTETIAPEGYVLSESTVEFTVKDDGTTTKVVMYNSKENTPVPPAPENPSKHQVEISKQDITTKSELPGATLIIKDAAGNEIDRWVSGTTPHYIELDVGDYTLTEVQAPIGYDLSYEVVKFSVSDTTDITRVVMYNSKTPNTSDRNITSIIGMMFISMLGIGGSVFKLKTKKNS